MALLNYGRIVDMGTPRELIERLHMHRLEVRSNRLMQLIGLPATRFGMRKAHFEQAYSRGVSVTSARHRGQAPMTAAPRPGAWTTWSHSRILEPLFRSLMQVDRRCGQGPAPA